MIGILILGLLILIATILAIFLWSNATLQP
jgi:hypothetical protein